MDHRLQCNMASAVLLKQARCYRLPSASGTTTTPVTRSLQPPAGGAAHGRWWGPSNKSSRIEAKRNPWLEVERDVLPDGTPNTPWRRLLLRINNTWTLKQLLAVYAENHYKSAVFNDKHRAALFNRIPNLLYYRVIASTEVDTAAAQQLGELLEAAAPELARPRALHAIDGRKLSQLLVCIAGLGLQPPLYILDPLVRELLRGGCQKLPRSAADLLAELALAIAKLGWQELELWGGIASAATALLTGGVAGVSWDSEDTALGAASTLPSYARNSSSGSSSPSWESPASADVDDSGQTVWHSNPFEDDVPGGASQVTTSTILQQQQQQQQMDELWPAYDDVPAARSFASFDDVQLSGSAAAPMQPSLLSSRSSSSSSSHMFLTQGLCSLAQGLSLAGVHDVALMDLLAVEAARKAPIMRIQQLTALLQAYADLGHPHAGLQVAAGQRLQTLLAQVAVQEGLQCLCAWSRLQPVPWELLLMLGQAVLDAGPKLDKQQALQLLTVMASACAGVSTATLQSAGGPITSTSMQPGQLQGASGVHANRQSSKPTRSSKVLPQSLVKVATAAITSVPLQDWTVGNAEEAARSLAALQQHVQPSALTPAAAAVAAAAVAHARSGTPEQLCGCLWGLAAAGSRDVLLLEAVIAALFPGRQVTGSSADRLNRSGSAAALESSNVFTSDRASSGSSTSSSSNGMADAGDFDGLFDDLPELDVGPSPWQVAPARRRPPQSAAANGGGGGGGGGARGTPQASAAGRLQQPPAGQGLVRGALKAPAGAAAGGSAVVAQSGKGALRRQRAKRQRAEFPGLGFQSLAELVWALHEYGRQDLVAELLQLQGRL